MIILSKWCQIFVNEIINVNLSQSHVRVMWVQGCRPMTRLTGDKPENCVAFYRTNNKTNVLPTFQVHNFNLIANWHVANLQ